jgi:putative CocE/NonD family hydrolase
MQLSARHRRIAGVVVAVLVAAVLVAVVVPQLRDVDDGDAISIPAGDGVSLAADVFTPAGSGKHPLVVLPGSWGAAASEYDAVGAKLAARGYVAVAYTQRGFRGSGGEVDFAGPATQRDASTVIDWALAHTPADASRIGLAGVSYGAGIALLAAERDPRIKAVAALSTWTDLADSLVPNGTLSRRTLGGLLNEVESKGRASPFDRELQRRLEADPTAAGDLLRARGRSARRSRASPRSTRTAPPC